MATSQPIGTHMLINIANIPDHTVFNTVTAIKPLLDIIIEKCDLHVVAEAGHQFQPFGATYVYVLSESHMSIHTYPENNRAYMDIFCCNPTFDTTAAAEVIKKVFRTEDVDYTVMLR